MKGYDKTRLAKIIKNFKGKRILVLGDVMLDQFIWGSVSRISPEAPVPVVEIKKETIHMGGAANVASNIWSLGGSPLVLGVVGDDSEGKRIHKEVKKFCGQNGLIVDKNRSTTVKTRIIAHNQQVCRADREDRSEMAGKITLALIRAFNKLIDSVEGVVVSDYAKGLITKDLMARTLAAATERGIPVCIDPKVRNFSLYKNMTVVTPNQHEAEAVAGIQIVDEATLIEAGRRIVKQAQCQHLLITRGEEGMTLFEASGEIAHIPTVAREVFDVTGAGDTVISTLTLALVSGASIRQAAVISNYAAGIVVGKLGTASTTQEELLEIIQRHAG
jgi:D-beta-D-heptose 7-phosphate kinase/D-beta-D-heptose 1-phosphate adenosyltransferase